MEQPREFEFGLVLEPVGTKGWSVYGGVRRRRPLPHRVLRKA